MHAYQQADRAMRGSVVARAAVAAVATMFALFGAAAAQVPAGLPTVGSPTFKHVHEGELGEKWLLVEENIRCTCGTCSEDVHHCQFRMECGTSPRYSERILKALQAGQTPQEVEASFVADFGTSILMEPPMEGFNLLGYFLPGVAIVMAGTLIGLLVRGGMGHSKLAPVTQLDAEDAERLREAMRKLDEAESPDW